MAKVTKADEEAVAKLLAAMGQLVRRLRAESRSGELSWSQGMIMARLDGGAMTTADLAGASLAVMEEDGLVRRKAHPTDGRQILFELTPAGIEGRYRQRLAKREWLLSAIAKLDKDEQKTLFAATDVIKHIAES